MINKRSSQQIANELILRSKMENINGVFECFCEDITLKNVVYIEKLISGSKEIQRGYIYEDEGGLKTVVIETK